MSQYRAGTITLTSGDATVTGDGTAWLTEADVGDLLIRTGEGIPYQVGSITDDGELELTAPYAGESGSGLAYSLTRDFSVPSGFPLLQKGDVETQAIVSRAIQEIDTAISGAAGAASLAGTSTSSVAIGSGAKAFTTQSTKFFAPGRFVTIVSAAAPATNWMFGQVTAYSGTDLTVDVLVVGGAGTYADWQIALSGARGATGAQGEQGIQGETGAQGEQGIQGETGEQGEQGIQGEPGPQGDPGADGLGVPTGGATAQVLAKASATDNDTEWVDAPTSVLRGYLAGLALSNNATDAANDIDIAAGMAADDAHTAMMTLASVLTKRLDAAWAVGSGEGGIDSGSEANSTWYHVWLIRRPDTGVVDALFSTSASSPAMPANYTQKRRIGAAYNDSSGSIRAFSQFGDEFLYSVPLTDIEVSDQGTTAVSRTVSVPTGVKVYALMRANATNATVGTAILFSSLDEADNAAASPNGNYNILVFIGGTANTTNLIIRTNTSGQIRTRANVASTSIQLATYGWRDRRGQDG